MLLPVMACTCWLVQVFMGSSIDTVTAVAEMVFTAVCARPHVYLPLGFRVRVTPTNPEPYYWNLVWP